ncbi:hypothetical protein [Bacillus horti]|uniref:Uncharacterized protein YpmS n=1 Tax=Caldalkalibacillus horti TaxID=77523 RepID=A0ABT9VW08_9BACI|nr:hypothetical protein [Bacillus horti]MDQ0165153.1 uncharacterized protein YpmS [Bacillus horti]
MNFNSFNRTILNSIKINSLKARTMVFVLPGHLASSASGIELRFPEKGRIVDIYASCSTRGSTDTIMTIEKCNQIDYDTNPYWVNILSSNIILNAHSKSTNTSASLPIAVQPNVEKNDHFRINVLSVGQGIAGVTVEVVVELDIK